MISFKHIIEAFFMPSMSLFGIVGNVISICVLHHKDVKLRKDFIDVLCSLAVFDIVFLICTFFLFSLPTWSSAYEQALFPMLVPVLFPMTNTFMTASIYMTVAIAVNRYMDMAMDLAVPCRIHSGTKQAVIVFVSAALFNLPRWLEFEYKYEFKVTNKTLNNGTTLHYNNTILAIDSTDLRENEAYVRDYTLIANTVCVLLIPTAIMLVSTCLIVRQMIGQQPSALVYTNQQEKERKKRNRSITLMLIAINVLFFVCHFGEVIVSLYEMFLVIETGNNTVAFPEWARNLIVVNHFLIVTNSSLNFVIYCKDLVFRQTLLKVYGRFIKKKTNDRHLRVGGHRGVGAHHRGGMNPACRGRRDTGTTTSLTARSPSTKALNHVTSVFQTDTELVKNKSGLITCQTRLIEKSEEEMLECPNGVKT